MQGFCHCKSCQRTSGGGHVGFIAFDEKAMAIEGERKIYTRPGGSGRPASRYACPVCYSMVWGTGEVMPGMINNDAGSLDDSAMFKPAIAIFVSEKPAWDDSSRNLKCFATVPGA
jgi:hypothetical protein